MTAELTLYKCYWPQVQHHLQRIQASHLIADGSPLLLTIELSIEHIRNIFSTLPYGAVVDIKRLDYGHTKPVKHLRIC
ncbi:MAG: hypothetical protein JSV66_02070 [Trueperaceae bacterium]|nr:MAG: hypothetical protein JSV66_02070 [Trueperaceae bacterium]